ncbi:MAG: hypothetical protein ACRC14_09145 [Paracoccaceae bacterium]
MTWLRVRRELAIFAALFVGLFVYCALEVYYLLTLGGFFPLTGIPTPGGAPLIIHLINVAIKGAWAAFSYGASMRLMFGKVRIARVLSLWLFGIATIAVLGTLVFQGLLDIRVIGNLTIVVYVLIGQIVVRDWVSR